MPKSAPIQTDFSGGEFGPHSDGRVDTEEYQRGLEKCYNYIPTLQGPLVRRPGTKYVADAKDPSKPPKLIPFKLSDTEQYMLEFGKKDGDPNGYVRIHDENGLITTSGTSYIHNGGYGGRTLTGPGVEFIRLTKEIREREKIAYPLNADPDGSNLELPTIYSHEENQSLSYAQFGDTLVLTCSSKQPMVLIGKGKYDWTFRELFPLDGPYLPLNSYDSPGDRFNVELEPQWKYDFNNISNVDFDSTDMFFIAAPNFLITNVAQPGGSDGDARISTNGAHNYYVGQKVFIDQIVRTGGGGAMRINNSNYQVSQYWSITNVVSSTQFDVGPISGTCTPYTGSGKVWPAIFDQMDTYKDLYRHVAIIQGSTRYWGQIENVNLDITGPDQASYGARDPYELSTWSPASFAIQFDHESAKNATEVFADTSAVKFWYMGVWNSSMTRGFPQAVAFHQDRLFLAGQPRYPQQFEASVTGRHNWFSPSDPNGILVKDTNALQFSLVSDQKDPIVWAKSGTKGVLMGTLANEFLVSPSTDNQAISPTNINSEVVGRYGSARVTAIRSGDAVIYVQSSKRKIRELNYFINVNKHKSVLINKFADHITYPSVIELASQKETYPMVYALRSDGTVAAMTYDRDEKTVRSGWSEFELGGRADSSDNPPNVKAMGVMEDASGTYDQLWMAVQRYINGTSVVTIEYMQEPFSPTTAQRDAKYLDCMSTHDSSVVITGMTQSGSTWVTAANHGFSNSDKVLITDVVGFNSSLINIDGVLVNSNLVNGKIFIVGSASTNEFFLLNNNSSYIDSSTYTPYFSGGKARQLVSQVTGLTHLKNETVQVLGDGASQGDITVNSAGVLALTYEAAVVHVGYKYKSRAKTLRPNAGGAKGTSIGMQRRVSRVAFNVEYMGDFSFGTSFDNLHPVDFSRADVQQADTSTDLFKGIIRDGIESAFDFEGQVCWEQSSPLPGMIKSITLMMETNDV